MTRPAPAWLTVLLLSLVALGALGVSGQLRRAQREALWLQPADAPWQLRPADGSTPGRLVPQELPGLPLQPGDELRFDEEDGPFNRYESFSASVLPDADAGLELRLRGDAARVLLAPGGSTLQLLRAGATRPAREAALPPREPGEALVLRVLFRSQGLAVEAGGQQLFAGPPLEGPPDVLALRAVGGGLRVLRLGATATRTEQDGRWAPSKLTAAWLVPGPAERAAADRRAALAVLALLVALGAFLRALCLQAPPWRALLGATLLAGAATLAAAWPAAVSSLFPTLLPPERLPATWWDTRACVPGAGLALLLALPLALRRLRPQLRASEPTEPSEPAASTGPAGRLRAVRAVAVAVLLAGATGWVGARDTLAQLLPLRAREQVAALRPPPAPFLRERTFVLDLANAQVVPGLWRDGELSAQVMLEPGAVLGVRVRAPDPSTARGLLLLLSTDPRLPSRWWREDTLSMEPLGEAGAVLPAEEPFELRVRMRGRELSATVDGAPLARAEDERFPFGGLVVLVQRGEATLSELAVTPQPGEPVPAASAAGEWRRVLPAALVPALALAAFVALTSWLLARPWPSLLEPAAFALLPFLLAQAFWRDGELLPASALRWSGLSAVGLLFLVVGLRTRPGQPARGCLALMAALAGVPAAMAVGVPDEIVLPDVRQHNARYAEWSGERLEEDLLYFTHPRFRLANDWLAQHRLRSGPYAVGRSEGRRRVLTLGASATWGYRLPPDRHLEWPALLAQELGPEVEVINGAFIGAPGFVLQRWFRDVYLKLQPDVLVLSLYYADAATLSQADEPGYLAEITAPGYRRSWLSDARVLADLRRGRERYERLVRNLPTNPSALTEAWTGPVGEAWPPARFEACLREFATLCAANGVELVLVFEPLSGDAPGVWMAEFVEALQRVGAEAGAPCIDPRPALMAAGGHRLCFDRVHLNEEGHAVLVREILPAVRAALDAGP